MDRLLSLDRLAPELKTSGSNAALVTVAALAVFAVAGGATWLGFHYSRSEPGISQRNYFSTEPFLTAPGARVVYYPEKQTAIVKGWMMPPLKDSGVYQVWALKDGRYQSIGMGDSLPFVDLTLVLHVDLDGVDTIIVTREPVGGALTPSQPLATLVPRP